MEQLRQPQSFLLKSHVHQSRTAYEAYMLLNNYNQGLKDILIKDASLKQHVRDQIICEIMRVQAFLRDLANNVQIRVLVMQLDNKKLSYDPHAGC